jgi:hypothetical protein
MLEPVERGGVRLCPGCIILKTLKIVTTADLLGVEYIRVRVGVVIIFSC